MAVLVANGAQIKCSMGTLPSVLTVTATPPHVAAAPVPAVMLAAITDFVPVVNIKSFGMCSAPTNPAVIAAQGSAPCVPATTTPWKPPRTAAVTATATFDQTATCQCTWLGIITVVNPGQTLAVTAP